MSINHPRPRQIRLPFSVPRPTSSTAPKRLCGICRSRNSQYACPRCNIVYCSLGCFQHEKHAQCSEPFYKATVMEDIASDPSADFAEKKKMLDILRKFEDAQAEGEDSVRALLEEGVDDEGEDELTKALNGVDLDEIDSNKLFHLLPQIHRDAFLAAIRDPLSDEGRSLADAARPSGSPEQNCEEDVGPDLLPWWEATDLEDEDEDAVVAAPPIEIAEDILARIRPPDGLGKQLAYNALAICLGYIHVLLSFRLPSLDPVHLEDQGEEVKAEMSSLVPFLVDSKSTVRHESVRDAWSAVWEVIGTISSPPPETEILFRLLLIMPILIHSPLDTDLSPKIFLAIADLWHLYAKPKHGAAPPRKLAFYVAALRQLARSDWLRLENEVRQEIEKLRGELEEVEGKEDDRPAIRIS